MDKPTRAAIERATQSARRLLEDDFAAQLEGTYDVLLSGQLAPSGGAHLDSRQHLLRQKIAAAVEHKRAAGMKPAEAVADYLRDAAFTTLNRFVALKMLEARDLVLECVSKGNESSGYREFCGLAEGVPLLPDGAGYRLYLECILDELSTEVKVLFDRRDPASVLWPGRATLDALLVELNSLQLANVWKEDETIGWVYQYFNPREERRAMRKDSPAPQNSRELAVRNQFFTPRYVVQFLTDNTLGRFWYEMRQGQTRLVDVCEYMVRRPDEVYVPRAKKDPRGLRILDPACGSGHFLLYAFDLLVVIYEEAWADAESPAFEETGRTLRDDYSTVDALHRELPGLILRHNLHGVDIDPRCTQIAQLALWMRAQRAFHAFGIRLAERPFIRRSNLVIAEPMPGEADLTQEFMSRLSEGNLSRHFEKLLSWMTLAGQLGLLLRVENFIKNGQRDDIFAPPADLLKAALFEFANETTEQNRSRRQLFLEDAVQGLGLLKLLEKPFDVVLMNPPFGNMPPQIQSFIDAEYPEGRNDIYAAFVCRGSILVSEAKGYLGAITSRAFITGRDHRHFRRALLQDNRATLSLFVDLGAGVLDGAMVETAAYVIGPKVHEEVLFIDTRKVARDGTARWLSLAKVFHWPRSRFLSLPQTDFLYDLDNSSLQRLMTFGSSFEPTIGRITFGLTTKDDFRFARLRWEVSPENVGAQKAWVPFSKGGDYSWFTADTHLVVNRRKNGEELAAFAELRDGNIASTRRSSSYYFHAAICFSRRSQKGFSARRIRQNACFSDKSGVIVPKDEDSPWLFALPAVLASAEYQRLIAAQSKFGSYEIGPIKRLPVPSTLVLVKKSRWASIYNLFDAIECADETSEWFSVPAPDDWSPIKLCDLALAELSAGLSDCGLTVDEKIVGHIQHFARTKEREGTRRLSWISWCVGVAFGRFNGQASRDYYASLPVSSFAAAPERSPGMMPKESSPRDILVDDEGHLCDLPVRVEVILQTALDDLPTDLRTYLSVDFFSYHLKGYSKSRRQAPIYWQLATPSARYSVWLYIHAFTRDTLFKVQNDYVTPKLALEERKLESFRAEIGDSPTAVQRRELEARETFVGELRAFLDEVRRVAPLWNPDLDDGVIINFAPLWRLVPHHKPWQKELKTTWDALCNEQYDWAHLAMHLWPERVVPKCATDRSLAIAHGLEDVFWLEGADGKWKPRPIPARPVDEIVAERTSPAVKAALKSLLEAPSVPGGGGRGRPRGRRGATA